MQTTTQTISTGWRVRDIPREGASPTTHLPWLPATVPGHVHLDLQRAGVIPDPFYRLHERAVAWVDETDWVYETTFHMDDAPPHAYLKFHGLDTLAEITLNGDLLGRTQNMYIPHEFPVGGKLKAGAGELGDNHLRVTFASALRVGRERQAAYDASGEDSFRPDWFLFGPRSFVRKSQYMYGWDWGPELLGCGIWGRVELVTVPVARITDWKYDVEFTDDNKGVVTVTANVERAPDALNKPLTFTAAITSVGYMEGKEYDDALPSPVTAEVSAGNSASASITIENARRWFPNGYNATFADGSHPPLYELEFSLNTEFEQQVTETSKPADFPAESEAEERLGLRFVDTTKTTPDPEAVKILPAEIAWKYRLLPLRVDRTSVPNRLMVAIRNTKISVEALDEIRTVSSCKIETAMAQAAPLENAIERAYGPKITVRDTITAKIGLRTVELIREPDADGKGEGFKFRVNGEDVYAKGANWIPDSSFPATLPFEFSPWSNDLVSQQLTLACDAGFNMLRVWGGGLYESEHFYELCDAHGILVWQDFPYACAYYPDTGEYAEEGRREATAAVKRIRNHPCLALWCGNNENDQVHYDKWGGQPAARYLGDHFYRDILPAVVAAEDPKTPYWPSSPTGGTHEDGSGNPNSNDYGDMHNWDVWHGRGDWTYYADYRSRFVSEFGFASSCGLAAWDTVLAPEDKHPDSAAVRWHDKTRKAEGVFRGYVDLHYPHAETLEDWVYYSQCNQADALKFGIEHFRRLKGRNWGVLFWQINDCWPTQSWAVIDSLGEPKAAYFACKKFYAPVLLSLVKKEGAVEAHLTNDLRTECAGEVTLALRTFEGKTLATETFSASVGANGTEAVGALDISAGTGQERETYVEARFTPSDGSAVRENILLLAEPKDLRLADPGIAMTITEQAYSYTVTVGAARFAPFVWLRLSDNTPLIGISDNFFHLRPGETRAVVIEKTEILKTLDDLRGRLVVRTL